MLRHAPTEGLRLSLGEILAQAMNIGAARCGSLQVYNRKLGVLELVAHHGLAQDIADAWHLVRPADGTVCARAWRAGCRVSVPSVADDPLFAPYRSFAERCGFRAVQSTPIFGATGPLGILSTHFASPYYLSLVETVLLDQRASHAAQVIEQFAAAA